MCGFSGIVFSSRAQLSQLIFKNAPANSADDFSAHLTRYGQMLKHRGGDDYREMQGQNYWLCHHRLAFQDVEHGQQPIHSSSGKSLMVFNGEIYNHYAVRKILQQTRPLELSTLEFANRGDALSLVEAHEQWEQHVSTRLEGEYAFVVMQNGGEVLQALRDPYGVKPLYFYLEGIDTNQFATAQNSYTFETNSIAFASEIKGLPVQKQWQREGFLRQFTGLFEPMRTPFQNVIALPAGACLTAVRIHNTYRVTLSLATKSIRSSSIMAAKITDEKQHRPTFSCGKFFFGNDTWAEDFRLLAQESVKERLLSDVELGVYLSGGIDSKVVGYELAQALPRNGKKLKSFTVGFADAAYDETLEVRRFAAAQNFDPQILTLENSHLNYAYPIAVYHSENLQPYTNGAAKWWLSRFTRQQVRGVLTGDGADEVLGGYPSFRYAAWWKFACRAFPGNETGGRNFTTHPLGSHWRDTVYFKRFASHTKNPWAAGSSSAGLGEDFIQSLHYWGVPHPLFSQVRAIAQTLFPNQLQLETWLHEQRNSVQSWFTHGFTQEVDPQNPENALLLWQNYFCQTHLPVQVLNWVGDRMEMANTLEGRTPFLSKKLRDFVEKLPDVALVAGFQDKALLRRAYTPLLGEFAKTPKKQFGAPFLNNAKLLQEFDFRPALQRCGIDAEEVLRKLQGNNNPVLGKESAAHDQVHIQSALQTLVSSAIVNYCLVEENLPNRNAGYEEDVLKSQVAR